MFLFLAHNRAYRLPCMRGKRLIPSLVDFILHYSLTLMGRDWLGTPDLLDVLPMVPSVHPSATYKIVKLLARPAWCAPAHTQLQEGLFFFFFFFFLFSPLLLFYCTSLYFYFMFILCLFFIFVLFFSFFFFRLTNSTWDMLCLKKIPDEASAGRYCDYGE